MENLTPIGSIQVDGNWQPLGLPAEARALPMLVLGRTGTGKSTFLGRLAAHDMQSGKGVAVIDPHGDLVSSLRRIVPESRASDFTAFSPAERDLQFGINPVEPVAPDFQSFAVAGLIDAFRKLFGDSWGPRSEHLLRNGAFLLQEQPAAALADLLGLFSDEQFRERLLRNAKNPIVREFWANEFPSYPVRLRADVIAPLQNKLGSFLADPRLARIFSGDLPSLRLRQIMDEGKILLVDLAKGRLGPGPAELLGSLLLARLALAAWSRIDQPENERRPFSVVIDEIHAFATPVFLSLLSECRKFGISVTVSLQYLGQMESSLRSALLGSVGTLVCFRLGVEDARLLQSEFSPEFDATNLLSLPSHVAVIKSVVGGSVTRAMQVSTLPLSI